jgi:hypothetical protein
VSENVHEELWLGNWGLTSVTAAIQLRVSHPFKASKMSTHFTCSHTPYLPPIPKRSSREV